MGLQEDTGAEVVTKDEIPSELREIIAGKALAGSAEELLRARYNAYKVASDRAVEFILETTHPDHLTESKRTDKELRDDTELTCKQCKYDELVVLKVDEKGDEATVKFRVWFRFVKFFKGEKRGKKRSELVCGPETTNTETSIFKKVDGKWLFVNSTDRDDQSFKLGDTGDKPATDFLSLAKRAMGQKR